MFTVVWVLGVSVGDDHFCQRQAVEDRPDFILGFVKVGYVVENDALAVVEADMDGPVLPLDYAVFDRKGDTFWLCDVDGFQVRSETPGFFDRFHGIVVSWCFADRSSYLGDVDVNDLLQIGVVDWAEVQWICVL